MPEIDNATRRLIILEEEMKRIRSIVDLQNARFHYLEDNKEKIFYQSITIIGVCALVFASIVVFTGLWWF